MLNRFSVFLLLSNQALKAAGLIYLVKFCIYFLRREKSREKRQIKMSGG